MSEEKKTGLLDDVLAIAAFVEFYGITAEESAEHWQATTEATRARFRAVAQAAQSLIAFSVEEHRWYAVVRAGGPDGIVVKVIGYRGDSGISCYDSLAEWEAAVDQ